MIYKEKFRIGMEDIGTGNVATNKAIIAIMEEVAGFHSSSVGYGILDVENTKLGWILIEWNVKVIRRPSYGEIIEANTWSRKTDHIRAFRDFELYDENNNIVAVGASVWVCMDAVRRRPVRITDELISVYGPEEGKSAFSGEIGNMKYPSLLGKEKEHENNIEHMKYKIQRRDIDVNKHMHNISYLEVAEEMLPMDVYMNDQFDSIRIVYKKEIKYGQEVDCYYQEENGKHYVWFKSDGQVNAVVEFG